MYAFPDTRWSLIATIPGQPQLASTLIGIYADAIGAYLHTRLAGERVERVDDIVQEVLIDLLGKPETLGKAQPGQGSRFRYYIMHLAWLCALNALRRHRRHEHAAPEARDDEGGAAARVDQLSTAIAAPEQAAMDRAWAVGVIQGALDDVRGQVDGGRLPEDALVIMQRHLIDGRPLRDIASELAMPLATCHRRCAHARAALQDAIAERLRLAGELGPGEDPAAACEVLLAAIAHG